LVNISGSPISTVRKFYTTKALHTEATTMIIKLPKILKLNTEYTHKNKMDNCAVKKSESGMTMKIAKNYKKGFSGII
jgi:hypothetical protein